jgi:hypothetical protein
MCAAFIWAKISASDAQKFTLNRFLFDECIIFGLYEPTGKKHALCAPALCETYRAVFFVSGSVLVF